MMQYEWAENKKQSTLLSPVHNSLQLVKDIGTSSFWYLEHSKNYAGAPCSY